jgi:hypothetical protein
VCGQVHGWGGATEGVNLRQGLSRSGSIAGHAIDLLGEHQILRVRGIPSQKIAHISSPNDHRQVAHGMARCRNQMDVAGLGHAVAAGKGAERFELHVDEGGAKPISPR